MKSRIASLIVFGLSGTAAAQLSPGLVGSTTAFAKSSICTKLASCKLTGSATVNGMKREFYHLKLKVLKNAPLTEYDLYVESKNTKIRSIALLYPPAQDGYGDFAFRTAFISAAIGYDLSKAGADAAYACSILLRGQNTNYQVTDNSVAAGYGVERITVIYDVGREDGQMFSSLPAGKRLSYQTECR